MDHCENLQQTPHRLSVHYSDAIWTAWHVHSLETLMFVHQLFRAINSSNARDGIFWLIWSIPYLLMPSLLKLPEHGIGCVGQKTCITVPELTIFTTLYYNYIYFSTLSEPMMVSLLTNICVTQPQWVKAKFIAKCLAVTYWRWISL